MKNGAAHRFEARIYRVGILRCVDVPVRVGSEFGEWQHPPVRMQVGGLATHTHLVPRGDGQFRLFLSTAARRAAGVDTGDLVALEIELDARADAVPFPDDLLDLAESIDGGLEVLETLPPGLRRQVLEFLEGAKSSATRLKRLKRIAELIRERAAKLEV